MSLKKVLLPAALIAVIALLAQSANAQTMGEYATTTAGVASGGGSMGTAMQPPDFGGSSQTWGASGLGSSFAERASAVSGSQTGGGDFESRAGASSSDSGGESRWPQTGISTAQTSLGGASPLDSASDRFSTGDRFAERSDFSSEGRWPGTSFADHMGLDTNYNSVNGN